MPAGLPATPWLQPPNAAGHFMQGFGLGESAAASSARIAQEQQQLQQHQQQLQQQAQQTQMEFDAKQKQHEQQMLMEQQQLEVQKQYHQAQIGMQQQKLQEAAKINQMKIQETARKSAIMQQAQSEIDAGGNQADVWSKYGPQLYGAGGAGYVNAAVNQQKAQAKVPPQTPEAKAAMSTATHEYNALTTEKFKLQKELNEAKGGSEIASNIQDNITKLTRRQRQLQESLGMIPPSAQTSTATAPDAGAAKSGKMTIVRDPKTGKLVVSNVPEKKEIPDAPPLTQDMFPDPENFQDQSGQPEQ